MDLLDYIKTIWDYNYWARDRIWPCIASVSEEDFSRPVEYSIGSLHAQVVHVMWAEDVWLHRLQNKPVPTYTTVDYPTRSDILAKWREVESSWHTYIAALTEAELQRTFLMTRANGEQYTHRPIETLTHIVNHSTDHRAQILQLVDRYGGDTVEQDMIFYFREKNTSAE